MARRSPAGAIEDSGKPLRHNIAEFDHHDQALLWAALQAGQVFAVVVEGPYGLKVAYVSENDPTWSLCLSAATERMIRIDQVDGLAEFASGPDSVMSIDRMERPDAPAVRTQRSRQ
jgi:hypothetical protein